MNISEKDKSILRKLAEELATIAALPSHKEKIEMWKRMNSREPVRPLVLLRALGQHNPSIHLARGLLLLAWSGIVLQSCI